MSVATALHNRRIKGMAKDLKRGEIWFADLSGGARGSEQAGFRPVLIIQNDIGNEHAPTTIIISITSQMDKSKLPTHIELDATTYNLDRDSVLLCEQVRTICKTRLKNKVSELDELMMKKVDRALNISLGIKVLG